MKILKPNWLSEKPYDYELKKYKFLASFKTMKEFVMDNHIYSILTEIEYHLDKLYKFKYKRESIEKNNRIITGINIDLMDLEYEYLENDIETESLKKITEFSISHLEQLHELIRLKWRRLSNSITITEIPDQKPTKKEGIFFIIFNDKIYIYKYKNYKVKDWRDFKIENIDIINNSLKNISQFILKCENKSDKNRFWRIDLKCDLINKTNYEDTILYIIKYKMFYKLKVN